MKILNLGCGDRFNKEMTNIDFISSDPSVISHNLIYGIPFDDQSFDVVYHSHIIEHFSPEEAVDFIKENFRVLKKGGIIRIAFPDLEAIAKTYLQCLNEVIKNDDLISRLNYEWIVLEMYDQCVRNVSGGRMIKYFIKKEINNLDFLIKRCGTFAEKLIRIGKEIYESNLEDQTPKNNKIEIRNKKNILKRMIRYFNFLLKGKYREEIIQEILGKEYELLTIGRFRKSGEIHQWMYDQYSISKLLEGCGFIDIKIVDAKTSRIPNWVEYNLDTEPDGRVYKPDSAFVEALKP